MSVLLLVTGIAGFAAVLWLAWVAADQTFAWQSRRFHDRQRKARALNHASKALHREVTQEDSRR